jgi:short-subunit dehydrogenase
MKTEKPLALVILVARRRERPETLSRELGGAEVLAADLTNDRELKAVEDRIDGAPNPSLLVNNAGFGAKGRFFEAPLDGQDAMHRLHVLATMRLTHAALRGMAPRDYGAVIDLRSRGSRVAVQSLSPGFTMSEFHDVMGASRDRIPQRLYVIPGRFYRGTEIQRCVPRSLRFALAIRYARAMKRTA